ncbi:hypothetical protein [Hypericibacter sp.]|uniref:hypothetical protein n=1 Tax=Hypericibacter sp. TaxID=2705401 RepID=UPI003D6CAC56
MRGPAAIAIRLLAALLIVGATLLGASSASATMKGCDTGGVSGFKVLLSDVSVAGVQADPDKLSDALYFVLDSKLQSLANAGPRASAQIVRCPGRQPRITGQDYTTSLVKALNTDDVLLDMWGSIAARQGSGQPQEDVWVAYYLIPLANYDPNAAVKPLQHANVSNPVGPLSDPVADVLAMLDQGPGFEAYASIVLGMKLAKNRDYDDARYALCAARARLSALNGNGAAPNSDLTALSGYVGDKLQQNYDAAIHDGHYNGAMKQFGDLLGKPNECPAG